MIENETPDIRSVPHELITDTETAIAALKDLKSAAAVAVDTETVILRDEAGNMLPVDLDVDGPGPWRVMSIAARFENKQDSVPHYQAWVLDMKYVTASALNTVFEGVIPWGWNTTFDRTVLTRDGLNVRDWRDGMIFDITLKQGAFYQTGSRPWYTSLEDATIEYLGGDGIEGKTSTRENYTMENPLTPEETQYAADDAVSTLFVCEILEKLTREQDLYETALRDSAAHPFIKQMKKVGLPEFDVEGYRQVIATAAAKAAEAGERVALLTSGQEILQSIVTWASVTGELSEDISKEELKGDTPERREKLLAIGKTLLDNPQTLTKYVQALGEQKERIVTLLSSHLGVGEPVEDLFSDGTVTELPFDLADEASIKRWLNKTAKPEVQEYLQTVGASNKSLVKAMDLEHIYEEFAKSTNSELVTSVTLLANYRRTHRLWTELTELSGAAKLTPRWNMNSSDQVKDHLNRYAQEHVLAYTEKTEGTARLLNKTDSADTQTLQLIGGPLCDALLDYSAHNKTLTTYGNNLLEFVNPETQRMHAGYQIGLAGTGRLTSSRPNAQNLPPTSKKFMGPGDKHSDGTVTFRNPESRRVLVAGDLSQAELRCFAHLSGDKNMLGAFRSGADLHDWTATLMFSVPVTELKKQNQLVSETQCDAEGWSTLAHTYPHGPVSALMSSLRNKAKAVSFGYAYGLGARALATNLTAQGVETGREEGQELLAKFDVAYPQAAKWMQDRVAFVQQLADKAKNHQLGIDYLSSWTLHRNYYRILSVEKMLNNKYGKNNYPTHKIAQELLSDKELEERLTSRGLSTENAEEFRIQFAKERDAQVQFINWVRKFYGSAMITVDGEPWSFESRTLANRRRLLQVSTEDWVKAMIKIFAGSRRKFARGVTDRWVHKWNQQEIDAAKAREEAGHPRRAPKKVSLTKMGRNGRIEPLRGKEMEKALSDKEQRIDLITFVLNELQQSGGSAAVHKLFGDAMADVIRMHTNKYRNHPIQGGVADAMNTAYGRLDKELHKIAPSAVPVQTVHDSIVLECDLEDALKVKEFLKKVMEEALAELYTSVPCVADVDIQMNLDESSIVTDAEIIALLEEEALKTEALLV